MKKPKQSEALVQEVRKWLHGLQPPVNKSQPPAPGIYLMRLRAERGRGKGGEPATETGS